MSQQHRNAVVIRLNGLRVDASIGILEHELERPQEIVINLAVTRAAGPQPGLIDSLETVLDYRLLRDICIEESTAGHVNMLETLAAKIAERVLALGRALDCSVEVVKPRVFADAAGVSVTVHRSTTGT